MVCCFQNRRRLKSTENTGLLQTILRDLPEGQSERLSDSFNSTLNSVRGLFGDLSFKIFDENLVVESRFNSALYDAEMLAVKQLVDEGRLRDIPQAKVQQDLVRLITANEAFRRSISIATSDESQVRFRVAAMKEMLGG